MSSKSVPDHSADHRADQSTPRPPAAVRLNSGAELPLQGFGLYKVPATDTEALVRTAIAAGYRLFDTARFYDNEAALGSAIRRAIADGLVTREELFITSKLWNDEHGFEASQKGFAASLARLGLDYLDLYLIHWPSPAQDKYLDTWRGFEALLAQGQVRSIGVSNFLPEHLDRLLGAADVVPAVNQIELHPLLQQREARAFHESHGIATQAWSPLARGKALQDPSLLALAAELGADPAELILRWLRDSRISAIPKASSAERIRSNLELPQQELSSQVLDRISGLDRAQRVGSDPRSVS